MSALQSLDILLADDNPNMRAIVSAMLKSIGVIRVREVDDGSAALEALKARPADLAIVDFRMLPGERFTESTRSIIDYLKFARTFDSSFPGFVADVHGLQHEDEGNGRHYTVDCIKE